MPSTQVKPMDEGNRVITEGVGGTLTWKEERDGLGKVSAAEGT